MPFIICDGMTGCIWQAAGWFGVNMILDMWDGLVARRQGGKLTPNQEDDMSLWKVMNFPGITGLGKWLDPFIDKLTNGIGMLVFGLTLFSWPVIWGFITWLVIDLFLLVGVGPLKKRWQIPNDGSNGFGKAKNWWQAAAVVWLALGRDFDWGHATALGFLTGALVLGILSIYGHLRPKPVSVNRPFANLT